MRQVDNFLTNRLYDAAYETCLRAERTYEHAFNEVQKYQKALDGIKTSASSMQSAAYSAESSLRDEIGSKHVRKTIQSTSEVIKICDGANDEAYEYVLVLRRRISWMEQRKALARRLAEEEREKKEQEERGRSR